ncbi:hypothetical protein QYC27_10525 [Thermosynechococcus sp. PP45]|nr:MULTISPECIES: hypothetical protein [unclassified Thermosynechococcus]WKT80719.1 hypothetical protein QYC27_10525 [Thermosynechococcus sp. PP45]WNC24330.1 hypothetical protein RHH26_10520 [Thermosynechococcus sp. PP551]WNC26908.1 hypothetical protein RHH27_10515 [Thermosynechococcus sp. PP555]
MGWVRGRGLPAEANLGLGAADLGAPAGRPSQAAAAQGSAAGA